MPDPSQSPSAPPGAIDEPVAPMWDEGMHARLAELIGHPKVAAIAARFQDDLQGRFADPDDIERLRRDAHTITSTAGMLGFTHLSNMARRVETACKSGAHATAPVASLLSAKDVAIDILETRFALKRE